MSLLSENLWRKKLLKMNTKGISLEEPGESLQNVFDEAVSDVEIFMDSEFEEVPEFKVVSEESRGNPIWEGIYLNDSNSVIFNPLGALSKSKNLKIDDEYEAWNTYIEGMQSLNEKDVLLEELGHALQDQRTGATNFDRSGSYYIKRKIGLEKIPSYPDVFSEGFMDFVVCYLGNRELETTQAEVLVHADLKYRNEQKGALSKLMPSKQGIIAEKGLDHSIDRYFGHLYYKSLAEEGGIDSVLETAFNPEMYPNEEEMFEKIQSSKVNFDNETYRIAQGYTMTGSIQFLIQE